TGVHLKVERFSAFGRHARSPYGVVAITPVTVALPDGDGGVAVMPSSSDSVPASVSACGKVQTFERRVVQTPRWGDEAKHRSRRRGRGRARRRHTPCAISPEPNS